MKVADIVTSRDNNFDVLRLFAALLVLISHACLVTGRPEPWLAGETFGGFGVLVFFAISGFLVTRSWHLDPRASAFIVKRVLRLWPALIAVLALTAFALGPVASDFNPPDYFRSDQPWRYAIDGARLHMDYSLPGAFLQNPQAQTVNASLWTLPVEVKAYVLVALLGLAGLLRRPLPLLCAFVAALWIVAFDVDRRPGALLSLLGELREVRLLVVFVGASLLYSLRDRIPLDWRLAGLAGVVVWLTRHTGPVLHPAVLAVTLPYILVVLAYMTPAALRKLVAAGDVSYGIYLWGYPIQQTIVLILGRDIAPGWVLLLSGTVTWVIAFASWRLIEAPALRLKRRLRVRAAPRPTPAV